MFNNTFLKKLSYHSHSFHVVALDGFCILTSRRICVLLLVCLCSFLNCVKKNIPVIDYYDYVSNHMYGVYC